MGLEEIYNLSVFQWDAYSRAAQIARMDETASMAMTIAAAQNNSTDLAKTTQERRDAVRYGQPFDETVVLERALTQKFGKPVGSSDAEIAALGFSFGESPPESSVGTPAEIA